MLSVLFCLVCSLSSRGWSCVSLDLRKRVCVCGKEGVTLLSASVVFSLEHFVDLWCAFVFGGGERSRENALESSLEK